MSDATVVCLYLFPEVNERLKPMLKSTLKPGSRVVSHDFLMGEDWKPEKEVSVKDNSGTDHTLYLWTIKDEKNELVIGDLCLVTCDWKFGSRQDQPQITIHKSPITT